MGGMNDIESVGAKNWPLATGWPEGLMSTEELLRSEKHCLNVNTRERGVVLAVNISEGCKFPFLYSRFGHFGNLLSHTSVCVCVGGEVTFSPMICINMRRQRGSTTPRGLVANCTTLRNSNGPTDALSDMCALGVFLCPDN